MTDHPLALPSGTVLVAVSPDGRGVEYLHSVNPRVQLDPAGILTGDTELVNAVWETVNGSDSFIDGDEQLVFLHCLTEVHPTGLSTVVPTARWFLPGDRDSLPDWAIAMAAVMPVGSELNAALDTYLREIENFDEE
ncbi:hypothetical protein [Mycolicibacter arupensis]|jgi:hypothetical protein|uniref:Uncharacterized protein n=1 Tax=Mycolicibacter arupensis TaxID=342002 RepID=A0A5C7Y1D3_9MYCO|nr:hypothetical protein [Mycolicibacter arupensis]TXI55647.1 MAG: hypothetical protein E6Q54_12230 [Mycolicibacter arupensis]